MAVWYYIRVSKRRGEDGGVSPEAQIQRCREYHREVLTGIPMSRYQMENGQPGIFVDLATSAFKKKLGEREAGYLLTRLVEPGDHVLFFAIDRGFRNLADWATTMETWKARGIHPHFISENIDTSTANGAAMADFMAVAAKHYSAMISERIKESNAIRKLRQQQEGTTPKPQKIQTVDSEFVFKEPAKKPELKSGRVFIYERCSHVSSYTSGLGLEAQSQANDKHVERLLQTNSSLVYGGRFVDEAVSAYKIDFADRPRGSVLYKSLKKGDHLVIYRIDRAWRRMLDAARMLEDLKKRGVVIHFSRDRVDTSSAFGEAWISMMSFMAKIESDMKRVRSLEVAKIFRSKGRPAGESPAGFHTKIIDGKKKLTVKPERMLELAMVWVLRKDYGYSVIETSDILHAFDCQRRCGHPVKWSIRSGISDRACVVKALVKAERARSVMPESAWESFCKQAIETINKPVAEKYMTHCRVQQPWGPKVSCEIEQQPQASF